MGFRKDLRNLKAGKTGEDNIIFELKNSGIPMYVLHDIYIEHEDLTAQIDFIVITSKINFIIECKNLYGNITINNRGDFIRNTTYNGKPIKEGIYLPITQNQRHLEILKEKKAELKSNIIKQNLYRKFFSDFNKSIVVLANPKTILNSKYAKKEIKNQVIRCDQLIEYIKKQSNSSKEAVSSNKQMKLYAEQFLKFNTINTIDYTSKYKDSIKQLNPVPVIENVIKTNLINKDEILEKLKNYRLEQSHKENVKADYIFTNKMLASMLDTKPKTLNELKKISGFGDIKITKYGQDIINIINIFTLYLRIINIKKPKF